MNRIRQAIEVLLRGRTVVELELARGLLLRMLYPAPHKLAPVDKRNARHFFEVVWYEIRPLIIGAEPVVPPNNPPPPSPRSEPQRAIVPVKRVKKARREWPGAEFLSNLSTDPGLILGVLSLAAGLLLWAWLSHGGMPAPRGGWLVVDLWLAWVPTLLCVAAFVFLALSSVRDLDIVAMDLQRRWAKG